MSAPVHQSLSSFRAEREADWIALEDLLDRLDRRSPKALSKEELLALPRLYRATVNALSLARAISLDQALIAHLEALTLRGYFSLHGKPAELAARIGRFFLRDWPLAVQSLGRETIAMALLMLLGAIAGFTLVATDPQWFSALVPLGLAGGRGPDASAEALRAVLFDDGGGSLLAGFALMLFVHNSQVSILSFSLGFFFGLPTVLLVLMNGCVLGAFIQIYAAHGMTVDLLGWLFIHGTTELFAVTLAAAGGIRIGMAVAFPGDLSRIDAAAQAGRSTALAIVGVVIMLFAAGILEGIGRQTITSTPVRYSIGGSILALWCLYFYWPRRAARPAQ